MPSKHDDPNAATDFAHRAFAPLGKFNETVVRGVEQAARYQYDLAGDWLHFSVEHLTAAAQARDVGALVSRQAEINTKFSDKVSKRSQDFMKLATEQQAAMAKWIEDASATVRAV